MDIAQQFSEMRQDAIVWKTAQIWKDVYNVSDKAEATKNTIALLSLIPSNIKRDSYVQLLSEKISKGRTKEMKVTNAQLKSYLKDYLSEKKQEDEIKEKRKRERNSEGEALKGNLNLPDNFKGDIQDVIEFGIFENENCYWSRGMKNDWRKVTNFTMRILFHVNSNNNSAYRLIAIENVYGAKKTLAINTDDFVSVSSFRKVLARQGDFLFMGSDVDLGRLSGLLQKEEKPTSLIEILGQNKNGFYSFSNGIVDTNKESGVTQYIPTDEWGIVNMRGQNYFIPANSSMFKDKEGLYQSEKKFCMEPDGKKNFSTWSRLHYNTYKEKSIIGQLWLMNTLFRDITFSHNQLECTPILCLAGQPSSGKGTFAKSLLHFFGKPQSAIGLGGQSTPKGFMRTFAQFKNAIVWLDEYKNTINRVFIETIKNIYDGVSYTRAVKSNDFQTDSLPVNSSCLLSGQEIPTIEAALLSRTMLLLFTTREKKEDKLTYTNEEQKNFNMLKDYEEYGMSSITAEILQYRHEIKERFGTHFKAQIKIVQELLTPLNLNDDRYVKNMALLLALFKSLHNQLAFGFSYEEAKATLMKNVERQFKISRGSNELATFWQTIDYLISQHIIKPGVHYKFSNDGQNMLYIRVKDIYPLYVKEMVGQRNNEFLSKSSLEHYLRNDVETYVEYKKHRNVAGSGSMWVHVFLAAKLQEKYEISLSTGGIDGDLATQESNGSMSVGKDYTSPSDIKNWDNEPLPF